MKSVARDALPMGRAPRNKHSTEYDFGQQFSRAACGRNKRGGDGARLWRRPAAQIARGGRATAAPGPVAGNFISRNRTITGEYSRTTGRKQVEEQGAFAREQEVFAQARLRSPISFRQLLANSSEPTPSSNASLVPSVSEWRAPSVICGRKSTRRVLSGWSVSRPKAVLPVQWQLLRQRGPMNIPKFIPP